MSNAIIKENNLENTFAYLDKITICGQTLEEHEKYLERFMKVTDSNDSTINKTKSVFRQTKISLLGHVIEKDTKQPNPDHLKPFYIPLYRCNAQIKDLLKAFSPITLVRQVDTHIFILTKPNHFWKPRKELYSIRMW